MDRIKLIFLLMLLIIPLASADIFRQDTEITFIHLIRVDGAPSDSINANITIYSPTNTLLVGNEPMTYNSGNKTFTYTLSSDLTSQTGEYDRCITATNGQLNQTKCFAFTVNQIGQEFTTAQSITYFVMLLVIVGLFLSSLWAAINVPWMNERNELGEIIQINYRKHLKLFATVMAYLFLVWISYLSWNLSYGFLQLAALGSFFKFVFTLLMALILPIFSIIFIVSIVVFLKDKKIQQLIDRNITMFR